MDSSTLIAWLITAVVVVIGLAIGFRLRAQEKAKFFKEELEPLIAVELYLADGEPQRAVQILEDAIKKQPARRKEFEERLRELKAEPKAVGPVTKL